MFQRLEILKNLPQPVLDYPQRILREHLYGVDLDPEAAEIAAVNLTMQAFADTKREKLPLILNENIKVGNSLISGTEEELRRYFGDNWKEKKPFNWEEEFPQIMAEGGFDVVIGNPPWVESKRMQPAEKAYYRAAFQSMYGQYDIFNGFVERGLQLSREHGVLGFIVPNRFIMNPDYEPLRLLLLNTAKILQLCDVGEHIFESVEMPAVITILQKELEANERNKNQVRVKTSIEDLEREGYKEYSVPQEQFLKEHAFLFTIYQPAEVSTIIQKIENGAVKFGELVNNARGVEIGKRSQLVSDRRLGNDYVPFLVGEDMDRFIILEHRFLRLGDGTVDYKNPELYQGEKILVRKTGAGIRATLDDANFYVIQVIYIFKPKSEKANTRYLLGLLNSKLMSFYHFVKFGEKEKKAFPHLRQELVLQLPIRRIDFDNPEEKRKHDNLTALADRMLELNKQLVPIRKASTPEKDKLVEEIELTDRAIDRLVYALYQLNDDEIKLIEKESFGEKFAEAHSKLLTLEQAEALAEKYIASQQRRKILQQELERIKEIIIRQYQPERIYLFGSLAQGEVHEWSDIDLCIIKRTEARFLERLKEIIELTDSRIAVSFTVYTPEEVATFEREGHYFWMDEIVAKGKIIYESS
jgi:predicted nucleotidyltransferase